MMEPLPAMMHFRVADGVLFELKFTEAVSGERYWRFVRDLEVV